MDQAFLPFYEDVIYPAIQSDLRAENERHNLFRMQLSGIKRDIRDDCFLVGNSNPKLNLVLTHVQNRKGLCRVL